MNPIFVAPIIDLISKGLDKWIPDPEAKARAQLDVARMVQDGEFKELETRMGAILQEAQSQHKYVALARPSFMYVFYFLIISMVVIAPVVGIFRPEAMELFFIYVGKGFAAIPEPLWWTFTSGYLGYGAYRTYEKKNGVAK
jgi:hypothetical protein